MKLPAPSEITDPVLFSRRRWLAASSLLALTGTSFAAPAIPRGEKLPYRKSEKSPDEKPTAFENFASYNNFYEFGPDKDSPLRNAQNLRIRPWQIQVDGEVAKPGTFGIEDLLAWRVLEERIYRFRCVEGWSAVVPWLGIPFSELMRRVTPTSKARFVEFWSLADAEQMPHIRLPLLDWPYREALRIDEAAHPLTLLTLGMYGETLPKQNGAPLRLIVPWKYGFKGAKSIVRIRFVEQQPSTSWTKAAPHEYGFYANVNPDVPHRRWSQAQERRLGEFLKRPTLPFNGYAEQVAHLYNGMDLKRNF